MLLSLPSQGAWIEMGTSGVPSGTKKVAPLTGAWVEIAATNTGNYSAAVALFTGTYK